MFQTKFLAKRTVFVNADKPVARFNINLKNINYHVQYENETTTVNTNDLELLLISNDPSASNGPRITFNGRLTFIDN